MRYLACLVVFVLLAAPACGGGSSCGSGCAVEVSIRYGATFPYGAWTELRDGKAEIVVDFSQTGPYGLAHVIAHELGHAAAFGDSHLQDPACLMHGGAIDVLLAQPCGQEAAAMGAWGATNTVQIVACEPALVAATVEAINLWNTPSAFRSFHGSMGE